MILDLNEFNQLSNKVYDIDQLKEVMDKKVKISMVQTTKSSTSPATAPMVTKISTVFPTICRQ